MKYLRYTLLGVVLILCVTVALANRAPVTLALWPDTMTAFLGFGYALTLPLFAIVGGAVGLGLMLGLVWEWLRERALRVEGKKAQRELTRVRSGQPPAVPSPGTGSQPRDQVLAILDDKDA